MIDAKLRSVWTHRTDARNADNRKETIRGKLARSYVEFVLLRDRKAACTVSWPTLATRGCERDYSSCPLGWLPIEEAEATRCKAPLTFVLFFVVARKISLLVALKRYSKCRAVQDFNGMSPTEKEEWQHLCEQSFPCQSRDVCEKDWRGACPADWYAVDGSLACIAPSSYIGKCSSVQNFT